MVRRLAGCAAFCVIMCFAGAEVSESYFRNLQFSFGPSASMDDQRTLSSNYCTMGIKKYVNSFTSYQFPNPFFPPQDPLSRLEFPIDQWFMGIESEHSARSWSLRCQGWANVSREGSLRMQDSDWDDENNPSQKTIFSESKCRLNRGLLFDIGLSTATPLEKLINVRPVFGYRYEYFWFTTHDGSQAVLGTEASDLPGDGIDFRQTFYHYYVGGTLNAAVRRLDTAGSRAEINVACQVDYAVITARNEDLHLLRTGDRITTERTAGHCWHACLRVLFAGNETIRGGVEADFKRLLTDGSHQLSNSIFNIDFSFTGSKVWSDQATVSAFAQLKF
jgi:hypothetical protein